MPPSHEELKKLVAITRSLHLITINVKVSSNTLYLAVKMYVECPKVPNVRYLKASWRLDHHPHAPAALPLAKELTGLIV